MQNKYISKLDSYYQLYFEIFDKNHWITRNKRYSAANILMHLVPGCDDSAFFCMPETTLRFFRED